MVEICHSLHSAVIDYRMLKIEHSSSESLNLQTSQLPLMFENCKIYPHPTTGEI